ncbi:MAG TPA: efflux RND transporter periplasmic adaptor subunit [Anaeromyxobacteraceae bacterium]|nr:efflux RND transporter periplasmic adaptor subunit [Anaeromyxobacteraceae bacterium]
MTTETDRTEALSPAPRAPRPAAALVAVALLGVLAGAGGVWLLGPRSHDHGAEAGGKKAQYQCPMHPTIVQDHPGDCPICGMKLVPMGEADPKPAPKPGERVIAFYRSPMDPKQTSHEPKKDEMGMDYVPVYQDELAGGGGGADLATVKIDPDRQQLIGLRTVEATEGPIGGSWRTSGRVAVDETRVHHLNVKFGGFVEHVHADFVGRPVRQGEPLFAIYSPELLAAQEEYLLALKTRESLAGAKGLVGDGDELVASARRKLELWDVPREDLERLERTRQAERTITIRSPASGVVVKKDVVPGMKVAAGDMPYEIVDLSAVWVLADVYETELSHVKVGAPATLALKAMPGKEYQGRVAFIDPFLDAKTRTAKVRLAFANPGGDIKPEMFGEVVLKTPARQGLRVPSDAVIDSGTRSVVFVALADGKFQPRQVRLGVNDGDQVEVLEGLSDGERVVTRANFLVDSESRLKASLQALGGGK